MRKTTDRYCILPGQAAPPAVMVIFGATGDLAKRKLLPALANLAQSKLLHKSFQVLMVGRDPAMMQSTAFKAKAQADLDAFMPPSTDAASKQFILDRLHTLQGEFNDPAAYQRLSQKLQELKALGTEGNAVFYLATPPEVFCNVAQHLSAASLVDEAMGQQFRRVIVEKPFGHDHASALSLNQKLLDWFSEEQIYRIDHYLGKETVQNILVFRFANGLFEPVWDRRHIDHVQITVAEDIGVERRGPYYETAGALRDMVQNHLFQLLSLIAMEPPASFDPDAVRNEKAKVLSSLLPIAPENAVRGQYGAGELRGRPTQAYRKESGVSPDSSVETYAALKVSVDNWRWAGVPFYLRTGKNLARRQTEIVIQFKPAPLQLFKGSGIDAMAGNRLCIQVAPREGITLGFAAKKPGPGLKLGSVRMDFDYAGYFGAKPHTGYETLLYDCLCGDPTLFQRSDAVELGWKAVDPLLQAWAQQGPPCAYCPGSWGPAEAEALLAKDGWSWKGD
jgi:glucose-6-phosphate 1-dehydrogenase